MHIEEINKEFSEKIPKDPKEILTQYIEANRAEVEIQAVRHALLSTIQDVKACRDQNIRALLYDLERCEELTLKFLTYWQVKSNKIESYMEFLTQEAINEAPNTVDKKPLQSEEQV